MSKESATRFVSIEIASEVVIRKVLTFSEEDFAAFGFPQSQTEVYECGECYALVTGVGLELHDLWHRNLVNEMRSGR